MDLRPIHIGEKEKKKKGTIDEQINKTKTWHYLFQNVIWMQLSLDVFFTSHIN